MANEKTPFAGLNILSSGSYYNWPDRNADNIIVDDSLKVLTDRVAHIEEGSELAVVASDPDADGVYKTVTWSRRDGTTYAKSTLSGDPYNRLEVAYYFENGTTVDKTIAWVLTIDANGIVSKKEII